MPIGLIALEYPLAMFRRGINSVSPEVSQALSVTVRTYLPMRSLLYVATAGK
jgi:hypothetical protein